MQKKISNENKHIFQKLAWNVYKFLLKKESVTTQNIRSVIAKCNDSFSKFMNNIHVKENNHYLKTFVDDAVECVELVKNRIEDLIAKRQRQQLLLCVRQIAKSVPLLVTALNTPICVDRVQLLNSYISKRVSWCFLEMEKAVENTIDAVIEEKECGGQFVQKMDVALDILSSDDKLYEDLKAAIDEVLCHAMSIAHVAVDADHNSISRNCQKVLRALEDLRQSQETEQPPMQELLVGALTDSLEHLEQQVNTALLQLVLEVFSALFSPLKQLLEAGDCPQPSRNRSSEDLDEAIIVFDLLMDRIMQIGLFAISCSQDTQRVVGIRSCLASLESLEPELVPALTALYLEPGSSAHKTYLQVLVHHWREEVMELQGLLHGIVDPSAFCEVALQDVSRIVATLKGKLSTASPLFLKQKVCVVLKKVAILRQQLNISLQEEHEDKLPSDLKQAIEDFLFSCKELNAASQLFLGDKQTKNLTEEERKRLLKRCELVVSMIKRVQPLLLYTAANSNKENETPPKQKTVVGQSDSTLHFPDSIRNLPIDQDSDMIFEEEPARVKNNFTELMKRGKALTKERSILYCTPKKNWERSTRLTCVQTPHVRRSNIFNASSISLNSPVDQTLGLDITNILENLTTLSNTLTSAKSHQDIPKRNNLCSDGFAVVCEAAAFSSCELLPSTDSFLSSLKSPAIIGSTFDMQSVSHEVDSIQRMEDLRIVQEKIANLRASVP